MPFDSCILQKIIHEKFTPSDIQLAVELQEIYKLYIVFIKSSMLEKVSGISDTYFTGFGNALV